jgi:hypothetical protein
MRNVLGLSSIVSFISYCFARTVLSLLAAFISSFYLLSLCCVLCSSTCSCIRLFPPSPFVLCLPYSVGTFLLFVCFCSCFCSVLDLHIPIRPIRVLLSLAVALRALALVLAFVIALSFDCSFVCVSFYILCFILLLHLFLGLAPLLSSSCSMQLFFLAYFFYVCYAFALCLFPHCFMPLFKLCSPCPWMLSLLRWSCCISLSVSVPSLFCFYRGLFFRCCSSCLL